MWLTFDPFWSALYIASTYQLPAFVLAIFFFLLVFFAPKVARPKALKIVLTLFIITLVLSGALFVAGLVLFLGFVLAPQVMIFLSAFLPASALSLLLARLLKREVVPTGVQVRLGVLPPAYAVVITLALTAFASGAVYALSMTMPKVDFPDLESTRKAVTLDSSVNGLPDGDLPEAFKDFVRTTEEYRIEVQKEEERYFRARKPFTYTTPEGTQVLISSTQELKERAPALYQKYIEDYALRTLTAHEAYMPERLRAELPRYRQEERVAHANRNAEAIEPLLRGLSTLGLPSDLTPIQVADSLIRFAPESSHRVDEVAEFFRHYSVCQTRKYFFVFPICMYQTADGTVYRIVEEL